MNEKKPEVKTCIKTLNQCSFGDGSHLTEVDVEFDKVIRCRPLRYDKEYNVENIKPWKINARGKVFKPPLKSMLPPYSLAYKRRVFSPNRVRFPLKRVDWDPDGERNPQNRGVSGYVRISWDEALTIIAKEIKRIIDKYGPYAILAQGDGHGQTKTVHGPHGCHFKLL
ncbi:MAG: molybdopterin-dependent oxidoreductase, partial [Candidatus Jordarchaeaceae archaeon]